jgi:Asp-tRNA(Asn)/Glu-tRNA(Gln) amidotransferase A subunit family amidase
MRALAEADTVDAHPDRAVLPLAGVPLAVKDNTALRGEVASRPWVRVAPGYDTAADDEQVAAPKT